MQLSHKMDESNSRIRSRRALSIIRSDFSKAFYVLITSVRTGIEIHHRFVISIRIWYRKRVIEDVARNFVKKTNPSKLIKTGPGMRIPKALHDKSEIPICEFEPRAIVHVYGYVKGGYVI